MNLHQLQSMMNYTKLGFTNMKVPKKIFKAIKAMWDSNLGKEKTEE